MPLKMELSRARGHDQPYCLPQKLRRWSASLKSHRDGTQRESEGRVVISCGSQPSGLFRAKATLQTRHLRLTPAGKKK